MAISRKDEENYFKLCNFNKLLSFSANVLNVKNLFDFEDRHSSVERVTFTVSGFYKIAFNN